MQQGILDRGLLQALIYSLVFHLVIFGAFRIRLSDYQDYTREMQPLHVAIDSEIPSYTTVGEQSDTQTTHGLFTENLDDKELMALRLSQIENPIQTVSSEEISALAPALTFTPIMYPLQLKLSSELKNLTLQDDGSKLFRKKGPYDTLGSLLLASNHFPIDYQVDVDGKTGKITKAVRSEVLLDKKLQAVADKLIYRITFAPFSEKTKSGKITLTFCCSGDEVKSLLYD
jgi:hypothetical protein